MQKLTGTGVALVTPFDEQRHIDWESLARLVEEVIAGGVDFLVVLGTTAETPTLTAEERAGVVERVAKVNRGRLPIVAGIGGNNTQEVMREIGTAAWLEKCQGILSVTPFYNKPSQTGLYEHFKAIASVSPLPVCLYNVPGRTGVNLKAETIARLAEDCPNITAVKEASGDFAQATAIVNFKHSGFAALSGDDAIALPLMTMGFDGLISVAANVCPRECATMIRHLQKGEYEAARAIHLRLAPLCKALFQEGNPAGIKAALHIAGKIRCNTLRLPLTPVSETLYAHLQQQLSLL